MPLEVLIATPSGPFGELIRLSLEADPEFHCSLLDNGSELWPILQEKSIQSVIFDCSFLEPEPRQVVLRCKEDFPDISLLLVPPENRGDIAPLQNLGADGVLSRPFDASSLPDYVKSTIGKKRDQAVASPIVNLPLRSNSWWTAFQTGIRETAASSGMIVQNGLVVACTPDTSTALQQQVTASVTRFWNPADSTDLMRYVKDLVTGQEWMMYASRTDENAVLVLLFLPQTPVTKVRAQTLKLASEISPLLGKSSTRQPQKEAEYLESSEPPRLHEILGENAEGTPAVIKNGFPVEWFKEVDLPEFGAAVNINEDALEGLPEENPEFQTDVVASSEQADLIDALAPITDDIDQPAEEIVSKPLFDVSDDISELHSQLEKVQDAERLLTNLSTPTTESNPNLHMDNLDLGNLQPVNLQPGSEENLDKELLITTASETESPDESSPEIKEVLVSETPVEAENVPLEEPKKEITRPVENIPHKPVDQVESEAKLRDAETPEKPAEYSNPEVEMEEISSTEETPSLESPEIQPVENSDFESVTSEVRNAELASAPFFEQFNLNTEESPQIFPTDTADMEKAVVNADEIPDIREIQDIPIERTEDLFERMNQLESAAQVEETETVTVALIPRSESMILQRQIAGALNQAMTRLCLAFNWKLDNLTIRPTYMQWTVTIPTVLSPDDMIGIVRKETSLEIVKVLSADFSLTDKETFWADQSMSVAGKDFVPSIHWQNFILRRKTNEIA
jgi:REP element-mobilizing transposase RayT/DNA-binding NarL/FixJ family response regulator